MSGVIELIIVLGNITIIFFKNWVDKDLAYLRATTRLAEMWRERTNEFAEAVEKEDVDRVAGMLRDLESRQLLAKERQSRDTDGS